MAASPAAAPTANPDLQAAARALEGYATAGTRVPATTWAAAIERSAPDAADAYYADVRSLTDQLARSRGRKLSNVEIAELLDANRRAYGVDQERIASERAGRAVVVLGNLSVAGIAIGAFIAVLFTFLFIRVERNLRIVRTLPVMLD